MRSTSVVRVPVGVLEGGGGRHHVPLHELADGRHDGGGAAGGAWTQGNLASRLAKPAHSLQGVPLPRVRARGFFLVAVAWPGMLGA